MSPSRQVSKTRLATGRTRRIGPRVLGVQAGLAVGEDDQVERLVAPAVGAVAVEERAGPAREAVVCMRPSRVGVPKEATEGCKRRAAARLAARRPHAPGWFSWSSDSTKMADSIMSSDWRLMPYEKNSARALAHTVRFSPVSAAMLASASVGAGLRGLSASARIHMIWLAAAKHRRPTRSSAVRLQPDATRSPSVPTRTSPPPAPRCARRSGGTRPGCTSGPCAGQQCGATRQRQSA